MQNQSSKLEEVDLKEYLDVFDRLHSKIGFENRKIVHQKGLLHEGIHVYVFNENGQILVQKRTSAVTTFKNMWHLSLGGHIPAKEDPILTAISELREELRLEVKADDLEKLGVIYDEGSDPSVNMLDNMFHHVFCIVISSDLVDLNLKNEEVAEIKFVVLSEYKDMITNRLDEMVTHSHGKGGYYNSVYPLLEMYLDRKNISYS